MDPGRFNKTKRGDSEEEVCRMGRARREEGASTPRADGRFEPGRPVGAPPSRLVGSSAKEACSALAFQLYFCGLGFLPSLNLQYYRLHTNPSWE